MISDRRPSQYLSATALFAEVEPEALFDLDHRSVWIHLRGGEILCRQGDAANAVFVVAHGSLEVLVDAGDGERLVEVIGRGASIGEMAVLTGNLRSATVRAVRDSDLIRIAHEDFARLLDQHAQIGINLARALAHRLRHTTMVPRLRRKVRTIAIMPASAAGLPAGFIADFSAALSPLYGVVLHLDKREIEATFGPIAESEGGTSQLGNWLDAQEAAHGVIVYECEPQASPWTMRALRQADLLLIVGRGRDEPSLSPLEEAVAAGADLSRMRQELVLVHAPADAAPSATERWLKLRPVSRHHHLRAGQSGDYGRLARSVSGTSVGVALSGGGARGFAHIGLLQALRDRGIAVDSIGGTSMGSVIAAQAALGWDIGMMIERNRKAFTEVPVVRDLTFPFVALMKGRSTVDLLRSMFGDVQIEDLWLPYFCVSTNLSRAEVVVHERGPLWLWVRSSSSVPAIGPPVPFNGDLLVDGGLLNNLPVDILRQRCPGPLIASDASPAVDLTTTLDTCAEISGWSQLRRVLNPWSRAPAFPNLFEILVRTASMSSDQSRSATKKDADLYLHPPLDGVAALDWAAIDRVVEIGYRHACEQLDAWQNSPLIQSHESNSDGHHA